MYDKNWNPDVSITFQRFDLEAWIQNILTVIDLHNPPIIEQHSRLFETYWSFDSKG